MPTPEPQVGESAPDCTTLVVIGADLDTDAVRERLTGCIATEPVSGDALYAVHRFTPR